MGGRAFTSPKDAAGFGIPGTPIDDTAFRQCLRVKGLREIGCGLSVLVVMLAATPSALGWFLLALAVTSAEDAVVVLRSGGPRATAYGVHAATAAVTLVTAAGLLA